MKSIKKEQFEQSVMESSAPVLVDFTADWCISCKQLAPALSHLEKEKEEVKLYSVNVDEEQSLANHFGVMSLPTVVLFEKGKEVGRFSGALPLKQIRDFLSENGI